MAAPHPQTVPVGPDTLISVKVIIDGTTRRFKLALRDLGANSLPTKVSTALHYSLMAFEPVLSEVASFTNQLQHTCSFHPQGLY